MGDEIPADVIKEAMLENSIISKCVKTGRRRRKKKRCSSNGSNFQTSGIL